MKSKLFTKIIMILLIVLFTISMFSNFVYADNFDLGAYGDSADESITKPVETVVGGILGVVRIVCTGIAIIMITVVAIKYLSAAPSDRAELKKSAIQYLVGAFILFGSANIFVILKDFILKVLPES